MNEEEEWMAEKWTWDLRKNNQSTVDFLQEQKRTQVILSDLNLMGGHSSLDRLTLE